MRFIVLGVLSIGFAAAAQELTPPPMPPSATPDSVLPTTPPDAKTFTGEFSSRISFFSTDPKIRFEVSIDRGRAHCKTPCTLKSNSGHSEITLTESGRVLVEDHVIPAGENHLLIRSASPSMVSTGVALLSFSASALVAAAVLSATIPYLVVLWLIAIVAPALVIAIPGAVLTAVGARRMSTIFVPIHEDSGPTR